MNTTDTVRPGRRWTFDAEVTSAFPDMLARSIPQHEVMREAVCRVASRFAIPGTDIVDLGCSRGEALAPLVGRFGASCRYLGLEVAPAMLTAARERFMDEIQAGFVNIRRMDLRRGYPDCRASISLAVLTLQFIPLEYRQRVVRDVFATTVRSGAFIVVEKVLGSSAGLDELFVAEYLALKAANGYSQSSIHRKRSSLEGVLVPMTARWIEDMLHHAGFVQIDCFWRWMNFAAWIAVKDRS